MDDVMVAIGTGSVTEVYPLRDWLTRSDELRGRVDAAPSTPAEGKQGGAADVLMVALGSGGAVTVLVRSLETWLKYRHRERPLELTVEPGKRVRLKMDQGTDSAEIIERILRAAGEGPR